MIKPKYFKHKTALIAPRAKIGDGTRVWAFTNIQDGAVVGRNCNICDGCFIEKGAVPRLEGGRRREGGRALHAPGGMAFGEEILPGAVDGGAGVGQGHFRELHDQVGGREGFPGA